MNIWGLLQVVLTAFEIGMCIWLCDALVYNGEIKKDSKEYLIWSILFSTVVVAWNRQYTFFSWMYLLIQIGCIWLILVFKKKNNKALCFSVIFDCQLLVALTDLALSFFAVNYLGQEFWISLYYRVGVERIYIYFLSRIVLLGMCFVFQVCKKKYHFCIEDYKGLLFSIGAVGT